MITTTHDDGRVTVTFTVAEVMALKEWFASHDGGAVRDLRVLLPAELKPERLR